MAHIFRNFLYLDQQLLNDYLAGIDLYAEEKVVETTEKSGSLTGEAGIASFKGSGEKGSKETIEVTKQALTTDAAKFQRLHSYLESLGGYPEGMPFLRFYESMDSTEWMTIVRDNVLEALVNVSLSKISSLGSTTASLAELAKLYQEHTGQNVLDEAAQRAISGFESLAKLEAEKGIPIIMTIANSPEYKLIAYLNEASLKVDKTRLVSGQVTVFCKIQSKFSPGEKRNLFNPLEAIDKLPMSREQRRKLAKGNKPMPDIIRDTIKAPAAVVLPVAIYR
jgi:hypothetical protein